MLEASGGTLSVYLTQKRLVEQDEVEGPRPGPYSVLLRATNGASTKHKHKDGSAKGPKVKVLTVVAPEGLDAFWTNYMAVLKSGMGGLKKKKKSKAGKVAK